MKFPFSGFITGRFFFFVLICSRHSLPTICDKLKLISHSFSSGFIVYLFGRREKIHIWFLLLLPLNLFREKAKLKLHRFRFSHENCSLIITFLLAFSFSRFGTYWRAIFYKLQKVTLFQYYLAAYSLSYYFFTCCSLSFPLFWRYKVWKNKLQ